MYCAIGYTHGSRLSPRPSRPPRFPEGPFSRFSATLERTATPWPRSDGHPPSRKTRFPAPGPALPDGIGHPQSFNERFHSSR